MNVSLEQIKQKERKIFSKVERVQSGCLEWQGALHPQGYGLTGIGKRKYYVHRLVMCLKVGRVLDGREFVCHKCDNPRCVNPDHLFVGTQGDNIKDMDAKGRRRPARGESNHHSRLDRDKVLYMRNLYLSGGLSFEDVGQLFGVSASCAHSAITGRTWKHVPDLVKDTRALSASRDRMRESRVNRSR